MFERFTEKARRLIFFGRYEASQFGSAWIEIEHLLLASLREDRLLASTLPEGAADAIRGEIERVTPRSEPPVPASVDLPLSASAKLALAFAVEEADLLNDKMIEACCLVLGMLRVESSIAPRLLAPYGIDLENYRKAARRHVFGDVADTAGSPALSHTIEALEVLLQSSIAAELSYLQGQDQALRRKPWTRKEALGHLVDWATAHHQWFARALAEPKVVAGGYPGENWIALEDYAHLPWDVIVELWLSLNRLLVHVLRRIPEEKADLPCRIGVAAEIPLRRLASSYVLHVQDFLEQILTRGQAH
ncbi:MAG TPA: Clp protease N-terminal domain-containing protein [Bryobacteraceae bacterium]|nr:Clp protease N-terminal domain-containing protein [Bryobacteraceae bacterium]